MATSTGMKKLSIALIGTAVATLGAYPAKAITLSVGGTSVSGEGYVSSVSGATTINFNNGAAPTSGFAVYSAPSPGAAVVSGSVGGEYATPAGDTTPYLTVDPVGNSAPGVSPVSISFANPLDYFGLYWGSVDTYNFLDFYSGNTLLKTFSGSDVSTTASGSWTGSTDNVYVNFFAEAGESFNKVVLRSDGIAFENDNHAYRSVPEPSSVLGLLAFGTLGAGTLLKRQQKLAAKGAGDL